MLTITQEWNKGRPTIRIEMVKPHLLWFKVIPAHSVSKSIDRNEIVKFLRAIRFIYLDTDVRNDCDYYADWYWTPLVELIKGLRWVYWKTVDFLYDKTPLFYEKPIGERVSWWYLKPLWWIKQTYL